MCRFWLRHTQLLPRGLSFERSAATEVKGDASADLGARPLPTGETTALPAQSGFTADRMWAPLVLLLQLIWIVALIEHKKAEEKVERKG